jgi:hypothetical protein
VEPYARVTGRTAPGWVVVNSFSFVAIHDQMHNGMSFDNLDSSESKRERHCP